MNVTEVSPKDLLKFAAFLQVEKGQSVRSGYNKLESVMTFTDDSYGVHTEAVRLSQPCIGNRISSMRTITSSTGDSELCQHDRCVRLAPSKARLKAWALQ